MAGDSHGTQFSIRQVLSGITGAISVLNKYIPSRRNNRGEP